MLHTRIGMAQRSRAASAGRLVALGLWAVALTPSTALAYIDPLSGSIFLQAILAGILGAGLTLGRARDAALRTVTRLWQKLTG